MGKGENYKRVGLFIIAALILLVVVYQFVQKIGLFDNSIRIFVYAEDVDGLTIHTPILVNGFKIGEVEDLSLQGSKIVIECSINEEIPISKSAKFYSTHADIMGGKQIVIKDFTDGEDNYQEGDTIQFGLIVQSLRESIDTSIINEIEPTLKEFSRTVGKALQEYGETETKPTSRINE